MINFIKQIAREAGKIIREDYDKIETNIKHKGNIDLVTETDLKCDKLLRERIQSKFPEDCIIIEESEIINQTSKRRWIIDPLDGTTNFSHRFPFCAVSIGLEIKGEIHYAVVYNPVLNELFEAEKGKGAFLNGNKISVSKTDKMSNALVATGFPYDRWEKADEYIKDYLVFMKRTQGVRRVGAAAIDLCYVACGRLDGFFERKLKPWDTAAGSLIVTEAGGTVSQFSGASYSCFDETVLASNSILHKSMIEIISAT
jgi:myo-inositol-1(or 4)-monophosphatase